MRNSELLKTLKNCKTLKNISIQFASQYLEDIVAAGNCFISLKGFKNLESLELYNFYGDEKRLTRDIDGVLSNCPSLKTLGLGKACDCDCKNLPEAIILVSECKFLENICIEFASRSKVPLALNTLRLGHGLCLFGSSSPAVGNVLEKMVKIAGLRKLHVFNGFIKYNMDEDRQRMEIDWSLLKDCTSLHQLSVSRLEDDVRKWLNGGGNSVEELIVTDHYSLYDEEMDEWDALNLPNLSMLFTREITVPKRTAEDDWLDTDSSGTESSDTEMSDNELPDIDSLDLDSLDVKLSDIDSWGSDALNSDESSCLQGRSRSAMTVLDRLHDHGSHLEKLGLCLDFERQWVSSVFNVRDVHTNYFRPNSPCTCRICHSLLNYVWIGRAIDQDDIQRSHLPYGRV